MAEEIKKVISIDTKTSSKSIKQLREEVAGLTAELEDLEIGSTDYTKKLEELVNVQNKLGVATESMQGKTVNAVKAFDSINQVAGGLAGGVSAVSAAFTLFGKDTENLQKTMVKLQAAIAIVQGIGGLKGLGEGILNGVKSFKALSVAITGTSAAMNGFKAALVSTGIGALLVAVGLLIDKLTSLKDEAKLTSDEIENIRQRNENLRTQAKESFWEEEYRSLIKLNPELQDEIENVIKATDAYRELNRIRTETQKKAWEEYDAKIFLNNIIELDKAFKNALTAYDKDLLSIGTRFGKTEEEISELFKNTLSRQQFLKKVTGKDVKEARLELERISESLLDNSKYLAETKDPLYDYQNLVKTGNKILEDRKKAEEEAARARKQALDKLQDEIKTKKAAIDKYWSDNEKTLLSETDRENLILRENYQLQLNDLKWLLDKKELTQEEYLKRVKQVNDAYNKEYLEDQREIYKTELQDRLSALQEMQDRESQLFANKEAALSAGKSGSYETRVQQFGSTDFYQSGEDVQKQYQDTLAYNEQLYNLTKDKITRENELMSQQQAILDEQYNNKLITEQEYTNQSQAIKLQQEANDIALSEAANAREEADLQAFKDRQAKKQQAIQATMNVASSLSGALANVFKQEASDDSKSEKQREKSFKVYKALATTQAIIDTISSAQGAYKAMVGIPIVGPILAPIAAATAVIAGIANVKAIQNEQLPSSGGSGSDAGTTAPAALNTAPVEYTRNLLGNKETDELNQPVKCYVVESDITTAQTKVAVTESNASF